ncbi:hypothetical protein NL317_30095, partial [Klebsiella pneumoniae]|nr:hypothetical protein [Klebsiella pneumoniae]
KMVNVRVIRAQTGLNLRVSKNQTNRLQVNRQDRKDLSHRLTVMRHQASHPLNRLANKMVGMPQNVAAAIAQANRYKFS